MINEEEKRAYFLRLVPTIRNKGDLRAEVSKLQKENKAFYDKQLEAIKSAEDDARLLAVGLSADHDSISFKMAQAFLNDAIAELDESMP